jgi:hypothetical protein
LFEEGKSDGGKVSHLTFNPHELVGLRKYTATSTHMGAIGALVLLGYVTVVYEGRAGKRRSKIGQTFVYSMTREQFEKLSRDVRANSGNLFV